MNEQQVRAVERAKQYNLLIAAQRFVCSDTVIFRHLDDNDLFIQLKEAVKALDGGAVAD